MKAGRPALCAGLFIGCGLVAPRRPLAPQFGVWYEARILVCGQQVEYWINGEMIVAYTLDTPAWREAVATSRYRNFPDFSRVRSGRIVLSGDGVFFRHIRIRPL